MGTSIKEKIKPVMKKIIEFLEECQRSCPSSKRSTSKAVIVTGCTKSKRQQTKTASTGESLGEIIENKLREYRKSNCTDDQIEKMLSEIAGGRVQLFYPAPHTIIDSDAMDITFMTQGLSNPVVENTVEPGVRMMASGKVLKKAVVDATN